MDITVVGPGAVGTLLGGLLSLKGHTVTFRSRRAPAPGARGEGLRLILPDRWLSVDGARFVGPGTPARKPGAVLVTLGRHHLHAVRRPDFPRLLGATGALPEAPILFINADPEEPVRLGLPARQGRGSAWSLCLTLLNAVRLQDGESELTTEEPTIVAEKGSAALELFSGLSGFGFRMLAVDDALPYSNSLFVTQLLFLPVAMCNTTLPRFLSFPEGRQLAEAVLSEGLETMERAGRPLARLPASDPRELLARIRRKPGSFSQFRQLPDRSYNTVLQSYLRGRPTEAPLLNKKAVEIASGAGLHLEWNWRVLQKAGRVVSLGFYDAPADLVKSLA
jgi:ketopantoate reductase